MNILNLNTLNFSGKYINSKYSNPYTTNSILNNKTTSDSVPDDLDRNNIQSLYDYSKDRIKDLHECFMTCGRATPNGIRKNTDYIIAKISEGGPDASYTEMILDLIKDKKLSPYVLYPPTSQINRNVAADLDKLFEAYADSKDVKEVFVPKFKNIDEAANGIEIGDVCQIEGNKNISTKLPDGTIKELFITTDTFLELFPPVERFITQQSTKVGDCYLLSALDSIQQNPNARHILYEMFRENNDGTVDTALGGFKFKNGQAIQKEPNKTIIRNISSKIQTKVDKGLAAFTPEGMRAIETLYEEHRKHLMDIETKKRYEHYGKLLNNAKAGIYIDAENVRPHLICDKEKYNKELKEANSILTSNMPPLGLDTYTIEELEYFRSFFESGEPMYDTTSLFTAFKLSYKQILNKILELNNKEDDSSKCECLILKRYLNGLKPGAHETLYVRETLPQKILVDIFDDTYAYRFHYNTGGKGEEVFEVLGLTKPARSHIEDAKDKLFDKNPLKYVFTCLNHNKIADKKIAIIEQHMYAVRPIDIEGERRFLVRNPHNTLNETICTYEELCKYFDTIDCAIV